MPDTLSTCREITQRLAGPGWAVCPGFIPALTLQELATEARQLWDEGAFRPAGIGIGDNLQVVPEIRNDRVLWLENNPSSPALRAYFSQIEQLRLALNQAMYLGLFSFEAHLAVYPPGSFYQRHLDQFRGTRHRVVSTVLYLNPDWQAQDGGQLRLYMPQTDEAVDVLPQGGTLAIFLSDQIEHEVLPARRERFSLTGWLRMRESSL